MLEKYLLKAQEKTSFLQIFIITFLLTLILGLANYFLGNNSLLYVALVSLAISYPIVRYLHRRQREELEHHFSNNSIIFREEREILMLWVLFIAMTIGFYIIFSLLPPGDHIYHQEFTSPIGGNFLELENTFLIVLFNNIQVGLVTFVLSFLFFSGFVLVIVWNSSIFAYYLYQMGSHSMAFVTGFIFISHALLEIGGYIMLGIAGCLLSYRISKKLTDKKLKMQFIFQFSLTILIGLTLIVLGAVVESL